MIGRDLRKQKFGRLKVINEGERLLRNDGTRGERMWHCKCNCGAKKLVRQSSLLKGKTRSCGCLLIEYRNSPEFAWNRVLRARLSKPKGNPEPKVKPPVVLPPFFREDDHLVDSAIREMVARGRQFDHVHLNSPIVPIGAHQ